MSNVRKSLLSTISVQGLAEKRQVLVNCSGSGLDRQGDIVVQEGIDTKSFMKIGGTVLWQHDGDHPIAKALDIGVEGGQLRSLVQFPDEGISAKADEIYGLVKAGIVNATSIGFQAKRWEPIDVKHPWDGRKYIECELMEFSFVSVPAMPEATVIGRSAAANSKNAPNWKVGASQTLPVDDSEFDADDAAESIFAHCNFDSDDADWSFARKGFLFYDASRPREKSSYLFPFAQVIDGRLMASPEGIKQAREQIAELDDAPRETRRKAGAIVEKYATAGWKTMTLTDVDMSGMVERNYTFPEERTVASWAKWLADPVNFKMLVFLANAAKGGRVMSEENMAHVKAISKCFGKCMDLQGKAMDSHGQTHEHLQAFASHFAEGAEHAKALMKSAKKPKPSQTDDGDGADDETDPTEDDSDVELTASISERKRLIEIMAFAPQ